MKWDLGLFKDKKTLLFIAVLLAVLAFIGKLSAFGFTLSGYLAASPKINYVIACIFALIGFFNCFRLLYKCQKLTTELAIRVYISSGFAMSGIYYMVYTTHIGCFSLPKDISNSPSIIDFIYFSFVTVTTVGYGDIAPQHIFVRMLVLCQVLFAIFLIFRVSRVSR